MAEPAEAQSTGTAQAGSAWSPYVAGALIGVLSMFTLYFSGKPIGASSSYAKVGGLVFGAGVALAARSGRSGAIS